MGTYFFYGTLIDPDIRDAVLGVDGRGLSADEDMLPGWKPVFVERQTYPVIVRADGAATAGVRVEMPGVAAREKLIRFEGPHYRAVELDLASGHRASVFIGSDSCRPTPRAWKFDTWERRHKRDFLARIRSGSNA